MVLIYTFFKPALHTERERETPHVIFLAQKFQFTLLFFFLQPRLSFEKPLTSWLQDYQQWQHFSFLRSTVMANPQSHTQHHCAETSVSVTHCADTLKHTHWQQSGTQRCNDSKTDFSLNVTVLSKPCHNQRYCRDNPSVKVGQWK